MIIRHVTCRPYRPIHSKRSIHIPVIRGIVFYFIIECTTYAPAIIAPATIAPMKATIAPR